MRFDPDKMADVFVGRQGKPPPWLEGLTSDARGRALVYALSAKHRNCSLLNFAIQKILRQAMGSAGAGRVRLPRRVYVCATQRALHLRGV